MEVYAATQTIKFGSPLIRKSLEESRIAALNLQSAIQALYEAEIHTRSFPSENPLFFMDRSMQAIESLIATVASATEQLVTAAEIVDSEAR